MAIIPPCVLIGQPNTMSDCLSVCTASVVPAEIVLHLNGGVLGSIFGGLASQFAKKVATAVSYRIFKEISAFVE